MSKYRAGAAALDEADRKHRNTLHEIANSGRTDPWQRQAKREARERVDATIAENEGRFETMFKNDVKEVNASRPEPKDWAERSYAAARFAQDLASLDADAVMSFYEKTAGEVSWTQRVELDRLAAKRLAEMKSPRAGEIEQARIDHMTQDELNHIGRQVDLMDSIKAARAVVGWARQRAEEVHTHGVQRDPGTPERETLSLVQIFEKMRTAGRQ